VKPMGRGMQNKMPHKRRSAVMRALIGAGQQTKRRPTMKKPQVAGRGRGFLGKKMRNRMEG